MHPRRHVRIAWILGGIAFGLLLLGFGLHVSQVWFACQRLRDPDWVQHASPAQLKRTAHAVIEGDWFPPVDPHDAYAVLGTVGDGDSVALLIDAVARLERRSDITCRKSCCISSLCRLTGEDRGRDAKSWQEWWASTGRQRFGR